MSVTAVDLPNLRAPLVIGITGHRDLRPEDLGPLRIAVRKILHGLQTQYPSTPLVVLSPLAEGADRLAAEVALEMGARLVVPLPMPQELYEQDFRSPDSLADFHRLLACAERQVAIHMLAPEKEVALLALARDRQYEAMGKYIAHQSQILIALWDGTDSGKIGGTAEIVGFQLKGVPGEPDCDLLPPELFPVYHILTPRVKNPHPAGTPFHLTRQYPTSFESNHKKNKKKAEEYYDQIFRNLEEFNREVLEGGDPLAAEATRSECYLLGDFDQAALTESEIPDLRRYAVADALARRFQCRMQRLDKGLHGIVFVAFVCFVSYAHIEAHSEWLLLAALVLISMGFFLYRRCTHVGLDSKNQDYRAIAEGSRVRLFWHLVGVRESVAENYLGKQRTELDWIRNGLRGWGLETQLAQQPQTPPPPSRLKEVRELWIVGQLKYFTCAAAKMEKKLKWLERVKDSFAWFSVAIAAIMLLGLFLNRYYFEWFEEDCESLILSWLIIATDVSLIAAALLHHYIQQKALPQHIKQFTRMEAVFGKARDLVDQKLKANDLKGVQNCLCNLGREALSENGDWVLLHRERPLEFPPP